MLSCAGIAGIEESTQRRSDRVVRAPPRQTDEGQWARAPASTHDMMFPMPGHIFGWRLGAGAADMRLRHLEGYNLHAQVFASRTADGSFDRPILPQSPDPMGRALAGSSRRVHLQSSVTTDAASERPSQRGDVPGARSDSCFARSRRTRPDVQPQHRKSGVLGAILSQGMSNVRIRPVCLPCLHDGVGDSVHHR